MVLGSRMTVQKIIKMEYVYNLRYRGDHRRTGRRTNATNVLLYPSWYGLIQTLSYSTESDENSGVVFRLTLYTDPVEVVNDRSFSDVIVGDMIDDIVLIQVHSHVFFHLHVFVCIELESSLQYTNQKSRLRRNATLSRKRKSFPEKFSLLLLFALTLCLFFLLNCFWFFYSGS